MSRARLAAIVTVVALLLCPSIASADSDILSWLDQLSGPGPFYSRFPAIGGHDFKIICSATDKKVHGLFAKKFDNDTQVSYPCLTNSNQIRWYVSVHFDFLSTYDQLQFNEATKRSINATVLETTWRWRFHPSLDAGVALGWTGFSDGRSETASQPNFSRINRFTATPVSVMLRPGEWFADNRWTRAIGVRFNEAILFGSTSSVDFGGALGAFQRGTEANARFALTFDYVVASFK